MKQKDKRPSWFITLEAVFHSYWIVVSCCLVSTTLLAAESPKSPQQAGALSAPVAISDSEIIPRAEQTVKSLQKIRSELAADPVLNSIQTDLAAFTEKSDHRRESDAAIMSKSRSVQRLNEILREWNLERSQLEEWDQTLAKRSQVLLAREKDVDRIIETWQATQGAVAKKFFFKAVLERRVEEVLREAEATRGTIQDQTTKLLKLQSQITDRLATLEKIRKEIDQAREQFERGLFALDSPPLWQALFLPEAQDTIFAQTSASARRMVDDLHEFAQRYRARILFHLVFFLVLVSVFYILRRSLTAEGPQRLGTATATFVLEHPFSSSLLLALISSGLFYPGAAAGILRIAIVPSVISVIRLLPGLLPQMSRHWVHLLATLYVVDFFRYLLPEGWLLTRILLLSTAIAGCAGLALSLRARAVEFRASGFRERLILLGIRLGLCLFTISVASNFLGNMTLAEILVAAPIRITYAAALIFAGGHLLMTLTAVALQSRPAHWLLSVQKHGELITLRCRALIRLAAVIFWASLSLYIVGAFGDVLAVLTDFLQLRWKLGAAEISVQDVGAFIAVFIGAVIFSRMLRFVLTEEVLPRIRLPRGVPGAVEVLSRYGIMLLGFFIALAAAGVDLSKVTLLISALGVGIGFGLQNVVNNFVSGLILVFEHPLQVGDSVEVGTVFGEVRKIGFRASVLRTPDGADVVIPNGELVGARFINWSLSDRLRRISISVGVAYGTDPNRIIDILVGIAHKHPAVLAEPAPMAVFDRFGDSTLNFTLFCWSSVDQFFLARSELTIAINNAFKEAGIQIPFPQHDVHVRWSDGQGATAPSSQQLKDLPQNESATDSMRLTGKEY